jgi:hypothetical protein
VFSCAPFLCDTSSVTPACTTTCASAIECAPGFACQAASQESPSTCLPIPPETSTRDYDGCNLEAPGRSGSSPRGSIELSLTLLAALSTLRRTGRSSRRPQGRGRTSGTPSARRR